MRSGRCGRGWRFWRRSAELNEADPELELQVRVGINTGEAVVALDARPEQGEGIVTGDVVNTAARIQAAAPVGGVAVGEQTFRATSACSSTSRSSRSSVKGKAEPLSLWQARAARARFGTDITRRYTTPLVGRELEKPLLIGTFERAAQQRSVQLVTIIGEPGVGKSRLVAELFAYLGTKPELTRWRQGRCLPYGEGITFWALGEIVKAEAGILESDSAEVAVAKLDAAVSPEEPERPVVGAAALPAGRGGGGFTGGSDRSCSRPGGGISKGWQPRARPCSCSRICTGRTRRCSRFSSIWPSGRRGCRCSSCARRDRSCTSAIRVGRVGIRNATTINLPPLSDRETAELVSHLITTSVLSAELEQRVLERAGGNPLYAEEFVRLLADRDLGAGEMELPESLQALIAARLDTLSPERKSLLQDAAVLGKVFWVGALAEIGGRDQAELELALHELARKELVRPARVSSMEGESEYSFWHLLVRDVAYGQIPRAERARRHRAAAAWIERKAGERVEDLAEVLAHHYLQALELAEAAGDTEQAEELTLPARRFLALAGERALGLDTAQAESRLARALELCPADDPERPELLLRWADAAFQAGRPREAAAALDEALDLFRARGENEAEARALILLARVAHVLGEGRLVALAAEAVALLEQEPPGPTLVAAHTQLAAAHFLTGSYGEAIAAADRACALAETLGLPEPARAIGARGNSRAYLGRSGRPRRDGTRAPPAHRAGRRQPSRHPPKQPRHRPLPAPGAGPLARRLRAGDRLLRAARSNQSGGDDGGRLPGPARRARPPGGGARASRCARCCRRGERRDMGAYVAARARAGDPPRSRRGGGRVRHRRLARRGCAHAVDRRRDRRGARGRRSRPARRRRTRPGARAPRRDRADARCT